MKKHVLFTLLTVCMGLGTVSAQSNTDLVLNNDNQSDIETVDLHEHEGITVSTKVAHSSDNMSYGLTMSLHTILSSDNGFDFNCHGGFCMQKKHTHKKGLSQNKQLFSYFMKVSG